MCGVVVAGPILLAAGCSAKANPVSSGGECFLATDCAAGLVCVEQANTTRICTNDLARVAGKSAPEAGTGDARAAEGGVSEAGDSATQPVADAAPE